MKKILLVFTGCIEAVIGCKAQPLVAEFYGLRFGDRASLQSKGLAIKEGDGLYSDKRVEQRYKIRSWYTIRKDMPMPATFFDKVEMEYSYKTRTLFSAIYYGHFPLWMSRRDCLKLMDEFSVELKRKFGIVISREGAGNSLLDDPVGFEFKDHSVKYFMTHDRYRVSGEFGQFFAYYSTHNNSPLNISINMEAAESVHGERIVFLYVDAVRYKDIVCKENIVGLKNGTDNLDCLNR